MSKFRKIKSADLGFVFTIMSLGILIGIGGNVEAIPPNSDISAWIFVLTQVVCAVVIGVFGSKMLLADASK